MSEVDEAKDELRVLHAEIVLVKAKLAEVNHDIERQSAILEDLVAKAKDAKTLINLLQHKTKGLESAVPK